MNMDRQFNDCVAKKTIWSRIERTYASTHFEKLVKDLPKPLVGTDKNAITLIIIIY